MPPPKQRNKESFRVGPKHETEVIFGPPWPKVLPAALERRGARRVLVLASGTRRAPAEAIVAALGQRCVGLFAEAAQHVPRPLASRALAKLDALEADTIVAIGGGSVIGLGKAVALLRAQAGRPAPDFAVLPTTYAGSEMTAIWGLERETGEGKEVGRDAAVRPRLVIYDPALSATLPVKIAIPSLFNAMAHAVDALFPLEGQAGEDAAELAELAEQAVAELAAAIARVAEAPEDRGARLQALAGSQKAGELLDRAGMSLHHKLAHVLGGTLSLPHAPTHTVVLPHVIAFMAGRAPRALARLSRALGAKDPAAALHDLQRRVGAPLELRTLGREGPVARAQIEAAADEVFAAREAIASPRAIEAEALHELLLDAWLGRRPSVDARRLPALRLRGSTHAGLRPALAGAELDAARAAIVCVHGRGSNAEEMIARLQQLLGGELPAGLAVVAVQAAGRSWYPHGFAEAVERNSPELDDALELLGAVRERVPGALLFGFSQGACLVLDQLAREGGPTAGVVAIAGALIGEDAVAPWHRAGLAGARVVMGVAERDSWVARARVEASADHLESRGAQVERVFAPGEAHTITKLQAEALRGLVHAALAD